MIQRFMRPLISRPTRLTIEPLRFNTLLAPLCARTLQTASHNDASHTPLESEPTRTLPYFVSRNNLNNLSVYQKNKRGGNYKLTLLKNGNGDLAALKQDIKETLRLQETEIRINSRTNHIEIKGHKRDELMNFLYNMGF